MRKSDFNYGSGSEGVGFGHIDPDEVQSAKGRDVNVTTGEVNGWVKGERRRRNVTTARSMVAEVEELGEAQLVSIQDAKVLNGGEVYVDGFVAYPSGQRDAEVF